MTDSSANSQAIGKLNPLRVYAESCILHVINELEGDAARRLRNVDATTFRWGEHWLDQFLGGFSIAQATLDFLSLRWEIERDKNPALTPQEFAREWAGPIFEFVEQFD